VIRSKNIVLRRFTKADVLPFIRLLDKKPSRKYTPATTSIPIAKEHMIMIAKAHKQSKTKRYAEVFAIEVDGRLAGCISLHEILYGHKAATGSFVAKAYRNKGIGTKVHKMLLAYAFKTYKLKRIFARVRPSNAESIRMLKKSGYKYEGTLRKERFDRGKYYDCHIYAVVR